MLTLINGKPLVPSGPVSPWPPEPQRKRHRGMRRWPLFLIASPAAVAIWSGWVALGTMCGFGPVNLLPGIGSGFTMNTAITLPVGVEAYGAYALGAWLMPGTPPRARRFARKSAIGSLALGVTGQVIYHLLAAAHRVRAPWPVVMVVACMPVVTLGFGAALTHLMRDEDDDEAVPETRPEPAPVTAPEVHSASTPDAPETHPADAPATAVPDAPQAQLKEAPRSAPRAASRTAPSRASGRARATVTDAAAEKQYAAALASGSLPSLRQIQRELKVGQPRAKEIRRHLEGRRRVVPIGERRQA